MEPTQDKNVRFSIEQILTTAKSSYIGNWNNQINWRHTIVNVRRLYVTKYLFETVDQGR